MIGRFRLRDVAVERVRILFRIEGQRPEPAESIGDETAVRILLPVALKESGGAFSGANCFFIRRRLIVLIFARLGESAARVHEKGDLSARMLREFPDDSLKPLPEFGAIAGSISLSATQVQPMRLERPGRLKRTPLKVHLGQRGRSAAPSLFSARIGEEKASVLDPPLDEVGRHPLIAGGAGQN